MQSESQNSTSFSSSLSHLGGRFWFFLITAFSAIALFLVLSLWNGRYNSGYIAGAGQGAVYERLYGEQRQEKIELERQLKDKNNKIARLTGQVERFKSKEGLFSKKVILAELEDMKQEAQFKLDEAERIRSEALQEAKDIGEIIGRAESAKATIEELKVERRSLKGNLRTSIILNGISLIAFILALGYIFLDKYGIIQAPMSRDIFPNQRPIDVSSFDEFTNRNLLKNSQQETTKALPSEDINESGEGESTAT